jgi:phosphatidylglycerol:prolipoprotein diacylglycerol transferase
LKPVLFKFGHFNVYSYGLMMVLAFFAVLIYLHYQAPKAKIDREKAFDLAIFTFISGILGSRIIYILINLNEYSKDWSLVYQFQKGGLAWHGGLLGGLLCVFIYSKIKDLNLWQALDLMVTSSALGLAIGRMGCFMNGCCFGYSTNLPWAVTFPAHRHPVPVHPTQLYEMMLDLLLFGFLLWWWNRRKFAGENALLTFSIYSVIRFFVEFFRDNSASHPIAGLYLAQWASLIIFIVITTVWIILRRRAGDEELTEESTESAIEDGDIQKREIANLE